MGFVKKEIKGVLLPDGVESFQQTYGKERTIDGVRVPKKSVFKDDSGGWFTELGRLNAGIMGEYALAVLQLNMSHLAANAIRFWHIHPDQNEVWNTDGTLLVGLVDLRDKSETHLMRQKVILTPECSLFIPAGVAHGFINPNNFSITLVYATSEHFKSENSQEYRVSPDSLSYDFVKPELM